MSKQEKHDARKWLKIFKKSLQMNVKIRAAGINLNGDPARLPK